MARWATFLLLIVSTVGFGQKIKYKELFVLLNAQQFEEAEPFLKRYLKVNDDNPNAFLFMGFIYRDKAAKIDLLRETEKRILYMDSAVYFFELANKTITEKELSRNDEYYQMYNRMDIRTGKYAIKMSDVKLNLEENIALKEKVKLAKLLKAQFLAAEKFYQKTQQHFVDIQKSYEGVRELYLQADDTLMTKLVRVANVYDSCHLSFNDYKATSLTFGSTGHNQDIDPIEITDFKTQGTTPADFYADDLKIWDYKRWALSTREIIEKEFGPLKEQLVTLDAELNKEQQRIRKDSVSVRDNLAVLRSRMKFPALKKIDTQPLPLRVFELKLAELEYGSQVAEDRALRDSLSIAVHVKSLQTQLILAKKTDSLSGLFVPEGLEQASKNYRAFIASTYGTSEALKTYLTSTHAYAKQAVANKTQELARKKEVLRWIVNGSDSIPLSLEVKVASRFKPLILNEKLTAGLLYTDTVPSGYCYTITPSRRPEVKAVFPVDVSAFRKINLPFTKAIVATDEKSLVFFVLFYSETKIKDKYPATLAKIYREEGLSWSIHHNFDQVPSEVTFSSETFVLSVKTRSSLGEFFAVNFDKDGKVVK